MFVIWEIRVLYRRSSAEGRNKRVVFIGAVETNVSSMVFIRIYQPSNLDEVLLDVKKTCPFDAPEPGLCWSVVASR